MHKVVKSRRRVCYTSSLPSLTMSEFAPSSDINEIVGKIRSGLIVPSKYDSTRPQYLNVSRETLLDPLSHFCTVRAIKNSYEQLRFQGVPLPPFEEYQRSILDAPPPTPEDISNVRPGAEVPLPQQAQPVVPPAAAAAPPSPTGV